MGFSVRASTLVVACGIVVSSAAAQVAPRGIVEVEERRRQGFWVSASLGAGAESFDLSGDGAGYSSTLTEPTVSVRLGGTPSEHFRLGGEAMVWFRSVPGGTESLSSLLAIGQWYPLRRAPVFLKAGAGLGRNAVDFRDGFGVDDVGFAVALGGGLEIPVGRRVAITPVADWVQHFYSGGREVLGYRERLLHVGVGVLFQTAR